MADRLRRERLGSARPPEWLGEVAREFWTSYAPYLRKRGCLTRLDEASFAVLCVTWERMTDLRQMMAREGQILTSPRGRKYQHPAIAIYKHELRTFAELIKAFGLAPLPRHRIPAMESGAGVDDPLDELLHRRTAQRRLQ